MSTFVDQDGVEIELPDGAYASWSSLTQEGRMDQWGAAAEGAFVTLDIEQGDLHLLEPDKQPERFCKGAVRLRPVMAIRFAEHLLTCARVAMAKEPPV